MHKTNVVRIWTSLTSRARDQAGALSPHLACSTCAAELGVSGASLLLTAGRNTLELASTTSQRVRELEELQARAGEGPGIDALESGWPILAEDLASTRSRRRWPTFAAEAVSRGVHAMFSLPLALGAVPLGVFDLVHDTPGELEHTQLLDALLYADTALALAIDVRSGITAPLGVGVDPGAEPALWRSEVHQAIDMVANQLGVTVVEALVRLRAYAFDHQLTLVDAGRAVVEHRIPAGRVAAEIFSAAGGEPGSG